jgi:hypothetical protein
VPLAPPLGPTADDLAWLTSDPTRRDRVLAACGSVLLAFSAACATFLALLF